MSLFIKGMNMPSANRLYKCELDVRPSGAVLKVNNPITGKEERYVVETISTPHGRLIDADALPIKDINNANYPSNYIKIAPTVIEAEVYYG